MAALDYQEAKRQLDASLGVAAYVEPTTPMKLALIQTLGDADTPGTEVAGGGYGRQNLAVAAATAGGTGASTSNTGVINFVNMPDTTANSVKGVEVFDSAGSPRRWGRGSLTTPRTTASGDTLSFAIGAITISQS